MPDESQAKKKILVIDDTDSSRRIVRMHLMMAKMEVIEATNGNLGIEYSKQHLPDLIICDLNMPDIPGFEVLKALRSHAETALTPFIFLTADNNRATRRRGMQLGADDFLTRPIDGRTLMESVNGQLQKYRQLQNVYYSKVDKLEETQKRLSLMIAHELRTPLVSILMAHEFLENQLENLPAEKQQKMLGMIGAGAHRLRHLTEQMILITQLETGFLNQESIARGEGNENLYDLIQTAITLSRQFDYRHRGNEIRFGEHNPSIQVRCHKSSLKHALAELINNAVKFSPDGAEIVISQVEQGKIIYTTILDYGSGMTEEDLNRAFADFEQVKRETQEQQGIGMGLPLAKRIIEVHGGTLSLKSVPGKGTQAIVGLKKLSSS